MNNFEVEVEVVDQTSYKEEDLKLWYTVDNTIVASTTQPELSQLIDEQTGKIVSEW